MHTDHKTRTGLGIKSHTQRGNNFLNSKRRGALRWAQVVAFAAEPCGQGYLINAGTVTTCYPFQGRMMQPEYLSSDSKS